MTSDEPEIPESPEVLEERVRRLARAPGDWPCHHSVTAKQRAAALQSMRPYGATKDDSPQRLTALAYTLGLAGGVECPVCVDLVGEVTRRMRFLGPPE
ncbi:MAG: hypothetical protein ACRD0A_18920 [Acidimicrobiales bacterium]